MSGKDRGLMMMLQTSPLSVILSRELLYNTVVLEDQLQQIFTIAKTRNALILLDEADFEGVIFLTTNQTSNFNPAILSRIHIIVDYPTLKQDQRRGIWRSSLVRALTAKNPPCLSEDEISKLSELDLNGRQINNIVSAAHALATVKKKQVRHGHIEKAVKFSQKFMEKVKGTKQLNSYFN
ncbi:hypothetical protein PISL3812_06926 [Talaromyces islandicus]|uniref:ATPase AAA-type core domain-containing protein n=1 Tax=Talaromyces islandicus TaxID=28573 RepID=A0A0U1M2U0_TALIS|nr:hypothetical protein PISL3812_06926 [Talaromyces islandicus]